MNKRKAVVAFSGGKDSTAAVLLLKKEQLDVWALFMKMGLNDEDDREKKIRQLTAMLGVPLKVADAGPLFKNKVIDYFIGSFRQGLTPNPCVRCNQKIKFALLRDMALKGEGADYFATGHYAALLEEPGKFILKEPLEKKKSQIYFLSMIDPGQLKHTIFPLANCRLGEVGELTRRLPLVHERESQDVCFLQGARMVDYLKKFIPEAFSPGYFIDVHGNRIGFHNGIIHFTIGQRRGTRFSSGEKLYVIRKDVRNNTIMLGNETHLYSDILKVRNPVFWKKIKKGQICQAKVRYLGPSAAIKILDISENRITAKFIKPMRAITAGQIGAFYEDDVIVAAGHIE